MSDFDRDEPRVLRLHPAAWPTRADAEACFAGLRTQWLVPYRDRRAPIPRQHRTTVFSRWRSVDAIRAAKRGQRDDATTAAIDRLLAAPTVSREPSVDTIRAANRRDPAVVAFREAARIAWAPPAARRRADRLVSVEEVLTASLRRRRQHDIRRTPTEQTAWWVRFLIQWIEVLWYRVGTERLTAQMLGRQMKQLAGQFLHIDFRHPR